MKRSCAFLRLRRGILVTAVLLGFCATVAHAEDPLKVVLFPYIPDAAHDGFKNLKKILQELFSNGTKGKYQADITIDPNLDLYNMDTLGKLLNDQNEVKGSLADVVEIDTLLLGQLVDLKWVAPLGDLKLPSILPNAEAAAQIEKKVYAAPTYLCTNVIYTRGLSSVKGGKDLGEFLAGTSVTPLVGNYNGSLTLSPIYLDALADTTCKPESAGPDCTKTLRGTVSEDTVDPTTMRYFRPLVESCATNSKTNPCLSGAYKSNHGAEAALVAQQANGYVGFTEGLFYILSASKLPVNVISAPLGEGTYPVMFVDALVVRKGCALNTDCFEKAKAFIQVMSTSPVRELIALSEDAGPKAIPRYLLQASKGFYQRDDVKRNPYYPQFEAIIDKAAPFPNDVKDAVSPPGQPEQPGAYKKLSKAVLKSLTSTQNPPN